jgi:hypothetical protein
LERESHVTGIMEMLRQFSLEDLQKDEIIIGEVLA